MIKLLSKETIQKIAAGEVIERPFSVVKELVENSIDAGSTDIKVEISDGGLDFIKVADNGKGIPSSEVELAVARHATSKLDNFNDLYNIVSLGFRGEALASITSISKTTIETKTKEEEIGHAFSFEDSKLINSTVIGKNTGTTIIVKDLFYNIPVRKRFLNSATSEANKITSMMYRLAIGNYNIGFTYIKDHKEVFRTIANGGLKSNLTELFGVEFTKDLVEVDLAEKNFKITGFISNNRYYRSNRSMEFIYINGRYVKNTDISNVVEKSYGSLIPNGRFPAFQLFVDLNPNLVDVNIHPNKEKVSIVILDELNNSLKTNIPKILQENRNLLNLSIERVRDSENKKLYDEDLKDIITKATFDSSTDFSSIFEGSNEYDHSKSEDSLLESDLNLKRDLSTSGFNIKNNPDNTNIMGLSKNTDEAESNIELEDEDDVEISSISYFDEKKETLNSYNYIGTIFKTYNIFESLSESKLILMDQHAAHERIQFEKFLSKYNTKEVVSQQLLSPILVNVNSEEIYAFKEYKEIFYDLGFEIDLFSDDTLIIRGLPDILDLPKTKDLFINILDRLVVDKDSVTDSEILNKIIRMSCKAAIKSGDQMSSLEIKGLLDQLLKCNNPLTCPHGRPTIVEISKTELEKLFLRIK